MLRRKTDNSPDEAEWEPSPPPRRFGRLLFNLLTAALVLAALLVFVFGSQKYHGFAENMDKDFLDDAPLPVPPIAAEIFPLVAGQKQTFQVTTDPDAPELLNKVTQVKAQNGTKLAVMQTQYKDKLVSVRAYAVTPKGLMLLALGGSEPMRFEPPLPMIRFPVTSGEIYSWQGKLVGKKPRCPARELFASPARKLSRKTKPNGLPTGSICSSPPKITAKSIVSKPRFGSRPEWGLCANNRLLTGILLFVNSSRIRPRPNDV